MSKVVIFGMKLHIAKMQHRYYIYGRDKEKKKGQQ